MRRPHLSFLRCCTGWGGVSHWLALLFPPPIVRTRTSLGKNCGACSFCPWQGSGVLGLPGLASGATTGFP